MAEITMTKEGEVRLDTDKHIVASINEYKGVNRLDVRAYWKGNRTQKGVNVPLASLYEFLSGIIELVNECTDENLMLISAEEFESA